MDAIIQRAIDFATKLESVLSVITQWKDDLSDVDYTQAVQLYNLSKAIYDKSKMIYERVANGSKKTEEG